MWQSDLGFPPCSSKIPTLFITCPQKTLLFNLNPRASFIIAVRLECNLTIQSSCSWDAAPQITVICISPQRLFLSLKGSQNINVPMEDVHLNTIQTTLLINCNKSLVFCTETIPASLWALLLSSGLLGCNVSMHAAASTLDLKIAFPH